LNFGLHQIGAGYDAEIAAQTFAFFGFYQ